MELGIEDIVVGKSVTVTWLARDLGYAHHVAVPVYIALSPPLLLLTS
jgi:hypothetical protein